MGDIKLAVKQARKVYVFEKLQDGKMPNAEVASVLELSIRQVQRIKKTFEAKGHEAFQHGNTWKKPARAFCENVKERVMEMVLLYRETNYQYILNL